MKTGFGTLEQPIEIELHEPHGFSSFSEPFSAKLERKRESLFPVSLFLALLFSQG